jgi:hypothetical protein
MRSRRDGPATWNFARRIAERRDRKAHVVSVASHSPINAGRSPGLRLRPFWTLRAVFRRLRVANNQMKPQSDRSGLVVFGFYLPESRSVRPLYQRQRPSPVGSGEEVTQIVSVENVGLSLSDRARYAQISPRHYA